MKKLIGLLFAAVALLTSAPFQAQGLKFGLKAGYNITNMDLDKVSGWSSAYEMGKSNKNGWYVGPTLKLSLPGGLGFDGSVFYDQRKSEINGESIKMKSVYVPINVRYNIGLGGVAGIYFAAGPQIGFNVGDTDIDLNYLDETKTAVKDKFQLKKSTFGINLGAGVNVLSHLEVGVVYCIPLGNTADIKGDVAGNIKDKYDVKSNTLQVSAAYFF